MRPNQVVTMAGIRSEAEVMVHPCYWKALDVRPAGLDPSTLSEVTDEEENVRFDAAIDLRVKQIGRVVQELNHVADGREGSRQFEEWVHRILKILFSGRLENFELKPNKGAANQRDIIATITQETGFWARVNRDYGTRQLVVEVKNYEEPTPDDLRQILDYSSNEYGLFALLVVRSRHEALPQAVKTRLKAIYHEHKRVILVIASSELSRCIEKFRKSNRFDYTEDQLQKKLDAHIRRTVAIRVGE